MFTLVKSVEKLGAFESFVNGKGIAGVLQLVISW